MSGRRLTHRTVVSLPLPIDPAMLQAASVAEGCGAVPGTSRASEAARLAAGEPAALAALQAAAQSLRAVAEGGLAGAAAERGGAAGPGLETEAGGADVAGAWPEEGVQRVVAEGAARVERAFVRATAVRHPQQDGAGEPALALPPLAPPQPAPGAACSPRGLLSMAGRAAAAAEEPAAARCPAAPATAADTSRTAGLAVADGDAGACATATMGSGVSSASATAGGPAAQYPAAMPASEAVEKGPLLASRVPGAYGGAGPGAVVDHSATVAAALRQQRLQCSEPGMA